MIKWFIAKVWNLEGKELVFLITIVLLASFLRFYRLSEYMTFLGDEGRDAIVVKRMLVEHHPPLLGPTMSVGNMYLGPAYYYMMAIPMGIFWLNPVSAAGMNALIGVLTVFLIYYLARSWFGKYPGLVVAFAYAISPVTIIYSRSSWNPNPAPFFTLLGVLGLYKAHQTKNFLWLILTGVALAFATQMHYLSLILIPFLLIVWIFELFTKVTTKRFFFTGTLIAILTFLVLMSPLLFFDIRHNFMNYHNITTFFLEKNSQSSLNLISTFSSVYTIYTQKLIGRYIVGENEILTLVIAAVSLVPIFKFLFDFKVRKKFNFTFFVITIWLFIGLILLALLNQQIYDHYLNFINPTPYLLLAGFLSLFNKKVQMILSFILVITLLITNFYKNPLLNPANNQVYRTQQVARFIIDKSENKPFNFALIAARNYDSAYQYYLDVYGHKPAAIPIEITDQLFVVCEDLICNPINHPKYEISGFGYAKVVQEDQVMGVKVFKLVSNPTGKP